MLGSKFRIKIITYLGVLPFYFSPIFNLIGTEQNYDFHDKIEKFSYAYGSLIIAFLSGMQWQKIIIKEKYKIIFLPIIPFISALTIYIDFLFVYSAFIIIFSLLVNLFIDFLLVEKNSEQWFKNLRINATILASFSFFL